MKVIILLLLLFANCLCFSDEAIELNSPAEPKEPIVQEANENVKMQNLKQFPSLPPMPSFPSLQSPPAPPNRNQQNNEPVREIEKYELKVSEAFPNGDKRRNVVDTIEDAHYTLYSNGSILIKLKFKNNTEYYYNLRSQGSKREISAGAFRQTYDIIIQVGKEILLEQYSGELYSNEKSITSLSIFGNGKIIVILNFLKK